MAVEQVDVLHKIDAKLGALLVIAVDDLLRRTPELANPRPRSIDQMLSDVGLSQGEIAALLGKSPQAVSQQLSSKKPAKKAAKKSGGA
jgi:hypothetical protein